MKKAIDQTVRDLKRGVNKKVLKVPGIEQKVLDATSNEPWGPHGSLLADIAIATTNYHEYQLIMAVIWRRIADTGKNWRHVYKALVLLEYLVAHGSERVIDEIKERSYQISMLSDFQYMDSSGRDQGSNVRRKSQSLVILVNDKAKVYEARKKAAANKDKLRNSSASGVYRTSSRTSLGGYGDKYDYDRHEDRNGDAYSREREFGIRDEVQYKNRLSYSSADGDSYGSRSYTDDNYGSSRGSGAKVEDYIQDERELERRYSGQSMGVPCSEETVGETQSAHSKRNEETSAAPGPTTSSGSNNHNLLTAAAGGDSTSPRHQNTETPASANQDAPTETTSGTDSASNAAPAISSNAEMDLLSILQDSFPSNSLAITPTTSAAASGAADVNADPAASQSASSMGFDDPFGDGPFKAIMTDETPVGDQQVQNARLRHPVSDQPEEITNLEFQDSFPTVASSSPGVSYTLPISTPSQSLPQEHSTPGQENDILAGILPPVESLDIATSQATLASPPGQPAEQTSNPYNQPSHQTSNPYSQPAQISAPGNSQPASPGGNVYGQPGLPNTNLYGQLAQPNANMFWQQTQSSANPYAYLPSSTANQYNQHIQSANSYFHPSQHTVSPYSHSQSLGNPHGQPQPQPTANGYGQSQTPANTYGQPPQPTVNPYSQSQLTVNPYGYPQPAGNPYGQQLHASPYSQHRLPAADPFSNLRLPSSNPYGQPSLSIAGNMGGGFNPQSRHMALPAPDTAPRMASGPASQSSSGSYFPQGASASVVSSQATEPHSPARQALQLSGGNSVSQQPCAAPTRPKSTHQGASASSTSSSTNVPGNFLLQADEIASKTPQDVPQLKEKFEPKSAVWADTLSRGLVNFNISGPKTNPLSDIGIDFEAMNRKEKRAEKPAASQVTSTVTMGKAMGSGSGMGRAGASTLRPPPNSMISPGMGMGMGMAPGTGTGMGMGMVGGPGAAMSMGGYGGMNQQPNGMGLNMGMGMAKGVNFQPQVGMHAASTMPGGYGSMMGSSGYAPQQPYGGNYR